MLRVVLSFLIGAHGFGHILFLIPLLGIADWGQSTRSWLIHSDSFARLLGSILWLVVITAFFVAVYGLLNQETWWRGATVIAAMVSTVGLVMFWATPVTSPVASALALNLAIVFALMILHFPSVDVVGV